MSIPRDSASLPLTLRPANIISFAIALLTNLGNRRVAPALSLSTIFHYHLSLSMDLNLPFLQHSTVPYPNPSQSFWVLGFKSISELAK